MASLIHLALQVHLSSDSVRHPLLLLLQLPQAALLRLQRALQILQLILQHNMHTVTVSDLPYTLQPAGQLKL